LSHLLDLLRLEYQHEIEDYQETTSKENSGVYFDHDNNSFAEQSGWVGKDDGLLVFDKNNNGKIDQDWLCIVD
jgi:hypothetical protein